MVHLPLLTYSAGTITIDEISFTNKFLKENYPKYAIDDNVDYLQYQNAGLNNHIIYKDGTKEELPRGSFHFEQFILNRYRIEFEYKEEVKKEQFLALQKKVVYYIESIYSPGITPEEKLDLYNKYCKQKNITEVSKETLIQVLSNIKRNLLELSDWTQLPDVQATFTEEEKQAWLDYRTAIRALDKTDDPYNVEVPYSPKQKKELGIS